MAVGELGSFGHARVRREGAPNGSRGGCAPQYFILLACLALLLPGCATTDTASAPLPSRDRVLHQYRDALQALRTGQFDTAKPLLDDALVTLGGLPGKDKSARQSRGLFREEARKTFVGEPYERVMAYYYRGILYWRDGEPDNARACFRSGQLMDSDAERNEYAADFMLLDYLDGFASLRLGADGADAFQRAKAHAKTFAPPAALPQANTFFFVEFGPGPRKYAAGQYGERLHFRTRPSPAQRAQVRVAGLTLPAPAYDDLNFQATTRGGRVMDHVLANKAQFKAATDTVGDAAIIAGAVLASDRKTQEAGFATLGAGLLSKIISSATTPRADTRCWDTLPQFLSFTHAALPPGEHRVVVEFLDASGNVVPALTKTWTITVAAGRDTVVFVSDQSTNVQKL